MSDGALFSSAPMIRFSAIFTLGGIFMKFHQLATVGAVLLSISAVQAQSTVGGAFESKIDVQGNVNQTTTGDRNTQNMDVGSVKSGKVDGIFLTWKSKAM